MYKVQNEGTPLWPGLACLFKGSKCKVPIDVKYCYVSRVFVLHPIHVIDGPSYLLEVINDNSISIFRVIYPT